MNNFREILKQEKYFLLGLFFISFLVRLLVFQFYLSKNQNYWQVDSKTYHKIAQSISHGKGVSVNGQPNYYRLPGYPLFLSAYYKIFGSDKKNVLWMQIFLASLIPILIFFLSLALFPSGLLLAKVSSVYSAVHLGLVLYSGFFMSESLFIFLLLIFAILFFSSFHLFFCRQDKKYFGFTFVTCPEEICSGPGFQELAAKVEIAEEKKYKNQILKNLFFAGIFLGLASLVRPVGHYLIVLSIILLFFSRDFWLDKIKNSLILFLGWLIPVSFWLIRNYMLLGQIFFHTLPGGHFLYFSAARIEADLKKISYAQAKENLSFKVEAITKQKEKKLGRKLNELELCDIRQKLAVEFFKKHPFLAVKNWATDILRTSLSLYSSELIYLDSGRKSIDYFAKGRTLGSLFKRHLFPQTQNIFLKFLIWFEIILFLFILLGCLFGFISAICNLNLCPWLKTLPFIFLFLFIGLAGGYSRMRLPVEPVLIILSFSFWIPFILRKKSA